jgi:hypothetical protein
MDDGGPDVVYSRQLMTMFFQEGHVRYGSGPGDDVGVQVRLVQRASAWGKGPTSLLLAPVLMADGIRALRRTFPVTGVSDEELRQVRFIVEFIDDALLGRPDQREPLRLIRQMHELLVGLTGKQTRVAGAIRWVEMASKYWYQFPDERDFIIRGLIMRLSGVDSAFAGLSPSDVTKRLARMQDELGRTGGGRQRAPRVAAELAVLVGALDERRIGEKPSSVFVAAVQQAQARFLTAGNTTNRRARNEKKARGRS